MEEEKDMERGSLAAAAEKTRESRSGIAGTVGEGKNRAEALTDTSGGHEASGGCSQRSFFS